MRRYDITSMEVTMVLALREPQPMLEMNMTPLIDVLLVLIIMFIITVPIQTNAVKIDLPGKPPPDVLTPNPVRNLLTIAPDGMARWNGMAADDATLIATLRASRRMRPPPELHLKPDGQARYERVDEVLATTKRSDITRMGFAGNEAYARF